MATALGAKGPLVLGVTWTEAALAVVLVALRAKTASFSEGKMPGIFGLRWDFLWIVFAMIVALTAQSLMTVSAAYGLGNHQSALSNSDIVKTNLWSWIAQIVAILCLVVGRIAVISFLLALQERTHRNGRRLLYVVGTLQGLINVVEVVLILKQCEPIQKLWDPSVPGTCNMIKICSQVGYLQGSIGAFADLFLAFYPISIIAPLQQTLKVKIGLCLIMGGGLIAGIAGINKTIAISLITQTSDITYSIYSLNTWVLTEMWFIIIFGSIPVLRPFFIRFGQTIRTTPSGHRSSRQNTNRSKNDIWVPLEDRGNAWATCDTSKLAYSSRDAESEEEILPRSSGVGQIMVTRDVQVTRKDMA
ncbi:hypothetical protein G7Y79_00050g086220 [Physcia stellaris]|nr:hypothetical protein G7Y79_00050g086220 [Physcia stellaris]